MMHHIQFGFQHTVQGERVSKQWHDVVAEQARLLEQILCQLHATVTDLQHSDDALERRRTRLDDAFEEASHVLRLRAQHHANLENRIATIRGSFSPSDHIPPGAEHRLHIMEVVNATLHANLALARRRVEIMRQASR